jgi:hypothetical protein
MWRRARTKCLIVLGLLLVCTGALIGTLAAPAVATDEPQDLQQPQRVREITELRDTTSKTYELADGSREWVGYAEAVHYKDSSGLFQEIDNSIVSEDKQVDEADYAYRNAANCYTARFGPKADGGHLVNIESRGKSIAFGPAEVKASDAVMTADFGSRALTDMTYGESCLGYREVYQGVDLAYEPKTYGVKEYLVLRQAMVQNEFTFDFKLRGLTVQQADGRISFVDKKGEVVFWLGEPLAVDDVGAMTEDVTYSITSNGGNCELMVTVSRAYLGDPQRVYPVILDPEVMICGTNDTYDTYVSSRYPTSNYYLYTWLRTGRDSDYYTRRTYLRFDLVSAWSIDPDDVTSAYVRIKKYSGATPVITAYRNTGSWASSTITWNNKPSYTTSECSTTATNDSGTWWRMYNLTVVKKWLNGTYPNYGWMIKDATESGTSQWTTFYSSDAASPNKPELHIWYSAATQYLTPYPQYTYDGAGNAVDPLNCFFGSGSVAGDWGRGWNICNSIDMYCNNQYVPYWWMGHVDASSTQYVTFHSSWGNSTQVACSCLNHPNLSHYHVRLFENPYATLGNAMVSGEDASCSSVGDAHHEVGSQGDAIDMDWEDAEAACRTQWKADHPAYVVWPNMFWNNDALDWRGWYDNGYMSCFWLWP